MAFAFSCANSNSGDDTKSVDAPTAPATVCGDGSCAATEVGYCPQDCGSGSNMNQPLCGDGTCDASRGETSTSCSVDCGNGGGGSGSGSGASTSCDQIGCLLCLIDATLCIPPDDQNTCMTCIGGGLGSGFGSGSGSGSGFGDDTMCDGGTPDGTCSATEQADPFTCISDCGQ